MKIKSLSLLILGLVMIALLIYLSISINKDSVLDNKKDVRVQLQWFHGAQFAGLYVAQEKGYFLDEGIRVKLNQLSTYTSDPIAILTAGNTDIALSSADQVLINKDNGKEIKAIGTVYNRSLACYVYKKSPEVDTFRLENLRGKKIGVYKKFDTENILLALDLKNKLNLLKKDIVQAGLIDAFIQDEFDFLGSYLINEPIDLRLQDINIGVLDPKDYDVNFYSDTYIVNTSFWKTEMGEKNPILGKFLRAAAKGWNYTKENPEEAIDIMFEQIRNKIKNENTYKKELLSLRKAIEFIGDGDQNIPGYMREEIWLDMEKDLHDINRISQIGYITDLCDFDIINVLNE